MRFSASSVALLASLLPAASATIYYAGVDESGGEFGVWSNTATVGTGLPGEFGVTYQFIDEAGIEVFVDQDKANLFRVAFLLERMCPVSYGLGAKFNETHWQLYREAIDYITITKGAYAILDPHNYMRYNDPSQQPMTGSVIGNSSDPKAATTAQFGEFWGELGRRFANNTKVIFGLMNEPHDMPTELVLANDQAAVDAIRRAGARNLILAPGNSWTGGHSWTQGGSEANSEWMYKLNDPIDNTAFDIHEYLDVDFSGSHSACVSDPIANLANLTSWLREHRLKALVSEFGGANNTGCYTMIAELINYLGANDEYIGWSAWAAGPLWGTYSPCCEDGGQDGSLEPGSVSSNGSPGMYITVWLAAIQPLLPSRLQWNGPASIHGGPLTSKGNSTKGGL